jgi:hypothetical protein
MSGSFEQFVPELGVAGEVVTVVMSPAKSSA